MPEPQSSTRKWLGRAVIVAVFTWPIWAFAIDELTSEDVERVPWEAAEDRIGEELEVCGPVAEVTVDRASGGQFVDLGNAYPNPQRFVIVSWEEPLDVAEDQRVCVSGTIERYGTVGQIVRGSADTDQPAGPGGIGGRW